MTCTSMHILDARLANVCFDGKYVKLIDFDRCRDISVKDVASEYNGHYMYKYSGTLDVKKRNVSLLDWKQLGLLIDSILNRSEKDADLKSICRLQYNGREHRIIDL